MFTDIKQHSFADGLLDSDEKFRALVEHSVVGIYILQNGRFSYVNRRLAEIFGYDREELIGRSNLDLTYADDRELAADHYKKRIEGSIEGIEYTFRGITKDGKLKYIHAFGSAFGYKGERAIIGTLIDETETVLAKQQLERLARFDSLTGLFNRHVFLDEFKRVLALASRHGHEVALLLFDIDNFKRINDSLGHQVGDRILIEIGERIKTTLRSSDFFARIGGDEFAIIIEAYDNIDEIGGVLRRMQERMEHSFVIDGYSLHLSLSIGIALFPRHGRDTDAIQKAADIAMYEAKKSGKNRYAFFDADSDVLLENIQMEHDLSAALTQRQFRLYLQPQIRLKDGALCCAEALIRWAHPEKGLLLPERFLPIAGESGMLYKLDLMMIERTFELLHRWRTSEQHSTRIAVNISNALFHHQHFLINMQRLHDRYGSGLCRQVELELTEEILMENKAHTDELLNALKALGFGLSIDDFGTGYSSLNHLKKLDVDKLKIDRTFIAEITRSDSDRAIVEAIVAMGNTLNLKTLAEGVESKKQIELLKTMGCYSVQGFYYGKPLPVDDFRRQWLQSESTR